VRLWTLHPKYLDARGLVALWREGLLARAVLGGATKGYRHHPQLERFRAHSTPLAATCERWPLRQRCAGIHSIDARLVGAGAVSYSAQPEGSLLMNGSIFCANCERAIQGFTPGGAGTYVRHLTHALRSLREVSRLGNGGGYGATAGSDRSPHIVEPDK